MTLLIRIVAVGSGALLLWCAAASRVVDHTLLPLAAIVEGAVVTQPFGCTTLELEPFDPSCPTRHLHTGIDLAARVGTAVHASAGGVARVGYDRTGAGLYVAVAFDRHVRVLYCHLLAASVTSGQQVAAGDVIGEVGASGMATGPHLHLEVQVNGRAIDPVQWLAPAP
jgi:murein DD-endopeptidase MepM/ murein hydrolase activator NlpD